MSKRNIYLVQVDTLRKLPTHTTIYLPYAAGALWIYAKQAVPVDKAYALRDIFFMRRPINETVARMENPYLVGFSCYVWSTEYNKALARMIKCVFPECLILFGGHNVPPGGAMLDELPYVDFLLHGEGEIPFQTLLAALGGDSPDFTQVPGLSYRTDQGTVTNEEVAAESVADFPSPYLEGVFDSIVAAHPEIEWSTVWETNRGCPHHCAYCDWGQHKVKIRQFSIERLLAEIGWMSTNRVSFIYFADANFGILPRDEELLDALVAARERKGYPRMVDCNTTKTIDDRMFRIAEKFSQSGLDKTGLSLAVQSLSPAVLRNIGRKNTDNETISQWLCRCRQAGHRTHTDLILGLPGETLQSFCAGVETLFTLGQHEGIRYFPCSLLPNAHMAAASFRKTHQISTTRQIFKHTMAAESETVNEYMDIVTATATMPHTDWLTANYFMFLVDGTHSYGLLRLISMYLHTENIIAYSDFYMRLLAFCNSHPDTLCGNIMARIERNFTDFLKGEESASLQIPDFSFGRMADNQYFFSRAVLEPARFYADVSVFLRQFNLEPSLCAQLLHYQCESILMPGAIEKTLEFDYDFPAYFNAIYDANPMPLQKRAVRLQFSYEIDISSAQKYFHSIVQLGRLSSKAFYRIEEVPL